MENEQDEFLKSLGLYFKRYPENRPAEEGIYIVRTKSGSIELWKWYNYNGGLFEFGNEPLGFLPLSALEKLP